MLKIRGPNGDLSLTWKSPYVDTVFILRRGSGSYAVSSKETRQGYKKHMNKKS